MIVFLVLASATLPLLITSVGASTYGGLRDLARDAVPRIKELISKYGYVRTNLCGKEVWVVPVKVPYSEFMRLRNEGFRDSDGDGLFDREERSLGTDPHRLDSDGDCLPDGLEVGYVLIFSTDKLVLAGEGGYVLITFRYLPDPTGSSIYYAPKNKELMIRLVAPLKDLLNPLSPDTDGDGLRDNEELASYITFDYSAMYASQYMGLKSGGTLPSMYRIIRDYEADIYDPLHYCLPSERVEGRNVLNLACIPELPRSKYKYVNALANKLPKVALPTYLVNIYLSHYGKHINNPEELKEVIKSSKKVMNWVASLTYGGNTEGPTYYRADPVSKDTDGDGLIDSKEVVFGSYLTVPDADRDGLPDSVEYLYGTNPLNRDTDHNYLPDNVEVILGTNPRNPDTDGDGLKDSWEVEEFRTNPLLYDSDGDGLSDYQEIYNPVSSNPLKPDTDGDGLSDYIEYVLHTNPVSKDTDGDGLGDYDEVIKYRTNPLLKDSDSDGLMDDLEIKYGTDPLNPDTDGDGLSDGDEITKYRTDPLKVDTDGDGLSDGEELWWGYEAYLYYGYGKCHTSKWVHVTYSVSTDPLKADTDGDGINDLDEMSYGTNPASNDTDGDGLIDSKDPIPYAADVDCDGLNDKQELARGTNPVNPDTDGDGVIDSEDNVISKPAPKEVKVPKPKEVRKEVSEYVLKVWSNDFRCKRVSKLGVVCKALIKERRRGLTLKLRFSIAYKHGSESKVRVDKLKRIEWVRNLIRVWGKASATLSNGVMTLTYEVGKYAPLSSNYFSDVVKVRVGLGSSDYTYREDVYFKLIFYNRVKPSIENVSTKWFKNINEGYLVFVCRSCSKVEVMAPGLIIKEGSKQKYVKSWSYSTDRVIALQVKPIPPLITGNEVEEVTTVPELKYYGGEEGGAVPMAKAVLDIAKSGQEVGYYLVQLSMAKSVKAKVIYGALATYNVIDSVVGGLQTFTVLKKAESEVTEVAKEATEEVGKESPYVKAVIDFIKDATVDKVKEALDKYAKTSEMEATAKPHTYRIVIKACNPYGCVTKSVSLRGVTYG